MPAVRTDGFWQHPFRLTTNATESFRNFSEPRNGNPFSSDENRRGVSATLNSQFNTGRSRRRFASDFDLTGARSRATDMEQIAILNEIERLIRRDPAKRGLIMSEESQGPLCLGHLAFAAADLAAHAERVVIVTGFFIPGATPPAAETDGPPGAAFLAAALASLGVHVQLVTDEPCRRVVEIAAREMNLPPSTVIVPGDTECQIEHWFNATVDDPTQPPWTHLIAIERVGPSHTRASIQQQFGNPWLPDDVVELAEFDHLVPEAEWNHCHNMRGLRLDNDTAPLHRLFELAGSRKNLRTIGIGDGGNEIGMGNIRWQNLRQRLNTAAAARIPCRIRTDWTIISGVSNWGGMALAAATLMLRGRQTQLQPWTAEQQHRLLERVIEEGPAVDGITQLPEPTVDGLPFLTYIQPWEGIRRVAGLRDQE